MGNYKYTTTKKTGPPPYTLMVLDPTPSGYEEVHITIPSDPSTVSSAGKVDDVWKQAHMTFIWKDTGGSKKQMHCFIKTVRNKYMPFDGEGKSRDLTSQQKLIWSNAMADQEVIDALFAM